MFTIAYLTPTHQLVALPVTGATRALDVFHALRRSPYTRNVRLWSGSKLIA